MTYCDQISFNKIKCLIKKFWVKALQLLFTYKRDLTSLKEIDFRGHSLKLMSFSGFRFVKIYFCWKFSRRLRTPKNILDIWLVESKSNLNLSVSFIRCKPLTNELLYIKRTLWLRVDFHVRNYWYVGLRSKPQMEIRNIELLTF